MRALIIVLFIFIGNVGAATEYRLYYAVGPLFVAPGSVRVGIDQYDVGALTPFSFGFCKNFYLGGLPYLSFGFVVQGDGPGFFGAMGLVGDLLWRFRWRSELQSAVGFGGSTSGGGILGLELRF